MNIEIRKTSRADIPAILSMIRDFAAHENLSDFCEVSGESLEKAIFGAKGFVGSIIALLDNQPIGYALFFPYFASFRGQRGIYLEDIYIKPEFRRSGAGEEMLRKIARIGKAQGAVRIDFQVLESNSKAIKFYKRLGAKCDASEERFKFVDLAFQNLAE